MPPHEPAVGPPDTAQPILLASGRELSKTSLFHLLHAAGWMAVGAVSIASDITKKGLWPGILEDGSWMVCGWALTLGFRGIYRRARVRPRSYGRYAVLCLLLSIAGGAVWYTATEAMLRLGYRAASHWPTVWPLFAAAAHTDAQYPLWIKPEYWLFFAIFLFTWSSMYFGINAMLDLETERANVARALKLADIARLRVLQSNLNPHFLFNALNSIATLIREQEVGSAGAMVDALSVFLRSTLERLDCPEIRVAEELRLIEQYLRIQRFRFTDRLRSVVEVDPEALEALIPTLILQPLVENAVRHGILPREDGGSLWVRVRKEDQTLLVSVEDDGPGLSDCPAPALGVGLGNCRDRLAALHGTAAQLTFGARAEGRGFAVVMRMPFCLSVAAETLDSPQAQIA